MTTKIIREDWAERTYILPKQLVDDFDKRNKMIMETNDTTEIVLFFEDFQQHMVTGKIEKYVKNIKRK